MSETALRRIGLGDPVSPGEGIIHHTEMVFNYGSAIRTFMYTSCVAKPGMRNRINVALFRLRWYNSFIFPVRENRKWKDHDERVFRKWP